MRKRLTPLAAALLLAAPALADWASVSSESVTTGTTRTIYRHEWTGTATDTTPFDGNVCTEGIEARFDPSTGDADEDATVEMRACETATMTWQQCRPVNFEGTDGVSWYGINAPANEKFVLAHATADTQGGDTARVEIRCLEVDDELAVGTSTVSPHASTHSSGQSDPISLQNLAGAVTDGQVPNDITINGALALDQSSATSETDFRYDASQECFYLDFDGDGTHDFSATEQCVDGTSGDSSSVPYDGRQNWCSPIAYEENGTTTTEGIQECIDYLGALGGGTVLLGPRGYFPTGPIVIDEGTGEIRIQGAGIGATFIQCLAGSCSANVALSVLDNDVTLSDFSMVHTVATRTAAIQVGDVSNYVSGVTLRRLKIDGASGESAGSRAGNGIHLRSLENRLEDIQARWFATGVKLEATTTGGVNANTFDGIDVSSADKCIDTNVGGDVANEGDAHQLWLSHIACQTINGAAITLRGGNSNPANYNSAIIRESHIESSNVGISILGGSGTRDPNLHAIGLTCSVTTSCVTADASADSTIIVESSSLDSNDCITHNGTGYVYTHALYSPSSPCTPTVNGTTSFWRSIDSDIAWRDEAVTITGAWDASGGRFEPPTGTAFPGSPSTNEIFVVTDDSAIGACDSAAGSAQTFCRWNGANWVSLGDGGSGGGGGDSILVDGAAVADGSGIDLIGGTTGIDITLATGVSPDTATWGVDLTELTCGVGLLCSSATAFAVDTTEIGATTWGSGSGFAWTFNAGATDPVFTFGSGTLALTGLTSLTLPASSQLAITSGCSLDDNLDCAANATTGGSLTLREDSDLGTDSWTIALGATNLAAPFSITPNTAGLLNIATLLEGSSANLRTALSDESGTGAAVFAGGDVGAATATTPAADDNDTSVATTAAVQTELTAYAGDTATFTNKTYDAEASGNVLTVVERDWYQAARCDAGAAYTLFDSFAASDPAAACISGSNTVKGVLDHNDTVDQGSQITDALATDWTGAIDVRIKWLSAATTGNVVWGAQVVCVADAETDDPAFLTAGTATDAAKGTTLQTNDAAISGLTATGCSAGELLHVRVFRDADNASDTMTGDARLIGLEVTKRRAI